MAKVVKNEQQNMSFEVWKHSCDWTNCYSSGRTRWIRVAAIEYYELAITARTDDGYSRQYSKLFSYDW